PFHAAGSRIALPPDSALVRNASRHSITEAGIGFAIEQFGKLVQDPKPLLRYLGPVRLPDFRTQVEGVEQQVVPGAEPPLPRGGRRFWYFHPDSGLPALVRTLDDTGHEVEYYRYDLYQYPVHLDDADFDPDQLWGKR